MVLEVDGPAVTPQELPSGSSDVDNFIGFQEKSFEPVNINRPMTAEEVRALLPVGIAVETSKANKNHASINWDIYDGMMPESDGEIIVKGKAVLPEPVCNLANLPLDIEVKVIADIPETNAEAFAIWKIIKIAKLRSAIM